MTPGKVHEYASCTTFSTTSEFMEGHYTFHRLKNKEEVFHVSIPRFHMVCPPFRESMVRSVSQGGRVGGGGRKGKVSSVFQMGSIVLKCR